MAIPQGPVREVRLLVDHRYPPGVQKLGSTPCEVEFLGRRGKPVKTMWLILAQKAFAFARKLQDTPPATPSRSAEPFGKGPAVGWWPGLCSGPGKSRCRPSEAMTTSNRTRKSAAAEQRKLAYANTPWRTESVLRTLRQVESDQR
jgi:hypothetical protein